MDRSCLQKRLWELPSGLKDILRIDFLEFAIKAEQGGSSIPLGFGHDEVISETAVESEALQGAGDRFRVLDLEYGIGEQLFNE